MKFFGENQVLNIFGNKENSKDIETDESKARIESLQKLVGKKAVKDILKIQSISSEEGRQEAVRGCDGKIEIKNLEKLKLAYGYKLTNEEILILMEKIPLCFRYSVRTIEYRDVRYKIHAEYGIDDCKFEMAAYAGDDGDIVFVGGSNAADKYWLNSSCLYHETGHLGDWRKSKFLTTNERLELLEMVLKRVESNDRHRFAYVERIVNKDKEKELKNKAVEYFAEIVSVYLCGESLSDEDRKIIEWLIKKIEPNFKFDPLEVRLKRISTKIGKGEV